MVGQEIAVVPSAVISCDEIYLQLSASANQFAELQRNLNHSVQIRNVTNLPSKFICLFAKSNRNPNKLTNKQKTRSFPNSLQASAITFWLDMKWTD